MIYPYDIKLLFSNSVHRILARKMCKSVEKCSISENENPSGVYRNNVPRIGNLGNRAVVHITRVIRLTWVSSLKSRRIRRRWANRWENRSIRGGLKTTANTCRAESMSAYR